VNQEDTGTLQIKRIENIYLSKRLLKYEKI